MDKNIVPIDKYGAAMHITEQAEADRYFEECVAHTVAWGKTRREAEEIERINLAYFAGYYDHKTRLRVERLFRCVHPTLGAASDGQKSPEEIFALGVAWAREHGRSARG